MITKHILAAIPLVVIPVPELSSPILDCLSPHVAATVRRAYSEFATDQARYGFKHLTFVEWVESALLNECLGHVAPWPGEERQ